MNAVRKPFAKWTTTSAPDEVVRFIGTESPRAQGRAGSVYRCTTAQRAAERAFNRGLGQEQKADPSRGEDP
jgi:hypothetical protein